MRLQQYLTEGRSRSIELDDLLKLIPHYSDMMEYYLKGGKPLMRGLPNYGNFKIVQPSQHRERESANTSNYYTLLTSNDPSWKHIPPRNRAIVGSTQYAKASRYGSELYVMVPKNGTMIAQSPTVDFWGSFNHAFGDDDYPLGNFNDNLSELFETAGIYNSDSSYQKLKDSCKKFDTFIKNNDNYNNFEDWYDDKFNYSNTLYYAFREVGGYRGNLYEVLVKIFNPRNISIHKAGQTLNDGVETWVSDDCLMIEYDIFTDKSDDDMMKIWQEVTGKSNPNLFNTVFHDKLKILKDVDISKLQDKNRYRGGDW